MTTPQLNPAKACDRLEKLFHEPKRLAIVSVLSSKPEGLSFTDLRQACECTDGNLSRHLKALEAASAVHILKIKKSSARAVTTIHLTESGKESFLTYLLTLEDILRQTLNAMPEAEHSLPLSGNRTSTASNLSELFPKNNLITP